MDTGGLNWTLIAIVGVALVAIVLIWAMRRNNETASDPGVDRTERATDRLYKEEDAARDPMDDGTV